MPQPLTPPPAGSLTTLHLAANQSVEAVRATINLARSMGADVAGMINTKASDSTWSGGYYPIHYACQSRLPDVVRVLLEEGASVNVKKNNGALPLATAISAASFASDAEEAEAARECIQLLLDAAEFDLDLHSKSNPAGPVFLCACPSNMGAESDGLYNVLSTLVRRGADVRAVGGNPQVTAVVGAILMGHVRCAELLALFGADVHTAMHMPTGSVCTPVDFCAERLGSRFVGARLEAAARVHATVAKKQAKLRKAAAAPSSARQAALAAIYDSLEPLLAGALSTGDHILGQAIALLSEICAPTEVDQIIARKNRAELLSAGNVSEWQMHMQAMALELARETTELFPGHPISWLSHMRAQVLCCTLMTSSRSTQAADAEREVKRALERVKATVGSPSPPGRSAMAPDAVLADALSVAAMFESNLRAGSLPGRAEITEALELFNRSPPQYERPAALAQAAIVKVAATLESGGGADGERHFYGCALMTHGQILLEWVVAEARAESRAITAATDDSGSLVGAGAPRAGAVGEARRAELNAKLARASTSFEQARAAGAEAPRGRIDEQQSSRTLVCVAAFNTALAWTAQGRFAEAQALVAEQVPILMHESLSEDVQGTKVFQGLAAANSSPDKLAKHMDAACFAACALGNGGGSEACEEARLAMRRLFADHVIAKAAASARAQGDRSAASDPALRAKIAAARCFDANVSIPAPLRDTVKKIDDCAAATRCAVCGSAGTAHQALKKCACGRAYFCGKDCQRAGWKAHKAECKAARGTSSG